MKNNVQDTYVTSEYIYIFAPDVFHYNDPRTDHLEIMTMATIVIETYSGKIIKNRYGPTDADAPEAKNKTAKVYKIIHEEKYAEWTRWNQDWFSLGINILADNYDEAVRKFTTYIENKNIEQDNWEWRLVSVQPKLDKVIV